MIFIDNFINIWNSKHHGSWRDYFIPHAGNNYQPHSLHPKRIAFHATSVIAIKAIVFIFAVFFPLSAWMTPDLAQQQGQKIIALTNDIRKSLNVPILKENQELDQAALAKAQDMLLNQYFAHISPAGMGLDHWLTLVDYKYAVAGENLAMGFATPEEVVAAWKASPTHYSNMIDPDFTQIGAGMVEGAFNGVDTNLVAQYFGAPESDVYGLAQQPAASGKAVKSTEKVSVLPTKKTVSPIINQKKTTVAVVKTPDQKEEAIKVDAYLATGTKAVTAVLGDTQIAMQQDNNNKTEWTGSTVVPATPAAAAPIAPAVIVATNTSGNTTVSDISETNIQPRQVTPLEQYFFFKNNPNKTLQTIFDISSIYFKIILLLAIICLLLNIFIEFHKQHPHLIISGVGLICLLVLLIHF
jgi:uncharacterized protein YkwD